MKCLSLNRRQNEVPVPWDLVNELREELAAQRRGQRELEAVLAAQASSLAALEAELALATQERRALAAQLRGSEDAPREPSTAP